MAALSPWSRIVAANTPFRMLTVRFAIYGLTGKAETVNSTGHISETSRYIR